MLQGVPRLRSWGCELPCESPRCRAMLFHLPGPFQRAIWGVLKEG